MCLKALAQVSFLLHCGRIQDGITKAGNVEEVKEACLGQDPRSRLDFASTVD